MARSPCWLSVMPSMNGRPTFATHNARITAERGSEATLDQWVAYAAEGALRIVEPGAYSPKSASGPAAVIVAMRP